MSKRSLYGLAVCCFLIGPLLLLFSIVGRDYAPSASASALALFFGVILTVGGIILVFLALQPQRDKITAEVAYLLKCRQLGDAAAQIATESGIPAGKDEEFNVYYLCGRIGYLYNSIAATMFQTPLVPLRPVSASTVAAITGAVAGPVFGIVAGLNQMKVEEKYEKESKEVAEKKIMLEIQKGTYLEQLQKTMIALDAFMRSDKEICAKWEKKISQLQGDFNKQYNVKGMGTYSFSDMQR